MLIVLTQQNCPSCENIKRALTLNGIPFREVSATSEEGKMLIKNYNIRSAGTIISEEKNSVVKLADLLEG